MRPLYPWEQSRADNAVLEREDLARRRRLHDAAVVRRKKRKRGGKK